MGTETSVPLIEGTQKFKTSHPNFQDALIVTQGGQQYIQNSQRMPKAHYDQWRSEVGKAAGRDHSSFLLFGSYCYVFQEKRFDQAAVHLLFDR